MKKTLAALIIGAFAASAANAAVVYDNEGTKVEINGSVRLLLEKSNQGGQNKAGTVKRNSHSGLRNDGSRFAFKVKHDLSGGYYALGNVEVRLDGKQPDGKKTAKADGFGDLNTKRAYIGLGHKERGEVRFGRQVTIADSLVIANDYSYGLIEKGDYVTDNGNSIIRYDYKGIEGLQLSASYQFAEDRDADRLEVVNGKVQNSTQFGALYEKDGVIAKLAFGRTNYQATAAENKKHRDGVLASFGYEFNDLTLSLDGGYAKAKFVNTNKKETRYFVSPGFQYQVTDLSSLYGNYKYEQVKDKDDGKEKHHGFLLGVDYKLHKQVLAYVEGKYEVTKNYDDKGNYVKDSKVKDKAIGVGLRVFF